MGCVISRDLPCDLALSPVEDINEVALLCLAITLLLSCAWSLNTIEMGLFW